MSAPNNFQRWDPSISNMESDSQYTEDPQRSGGAVYSISGTVYPSELHNKLSFQLTSMVTAIASMMSGKGYSMLDGSAGISGQDWAALVASMNNIGTAIDQQTCAFFYAVDTGTANSYVASYTPALQTLPSAGGTLMILLQVAHGNTGPSVLSANGLPARPIYSLNNLPLVGGELIGNGIYCFLYNPLFDGAGAYTVINPTQSLLSSEVLGFSGLSLENYNFSTTETVLSARSVALINDAGFTKTLYYIAGLLCNTAIVGAGGLSTDVPGGSIAGLSEIFQYIIWNGTIASTLFSTSSNNQPVLPAGYTHSRFLGGIPIINGVLPQFSQNGSIFMYNTAGGSVVTSPPPGGNVTATNVIAHGRTSQDWTEVSCRPYVPSTATRAKLFINGNSSQTLNVGPILIRKHGSSGNGIYFGNGVIAGVLWSGEIVGRDWIDTDSSQNVDIYVGTSLSSGWLVSVLGFDQNL